MANENLQHAFEQRLKQQRKASKIQLKIGDLVLLRVPHLSNASQKQIYKFFHIYECPYKIVRKGGNNAYELSEKDDVNMIKGVYNRLNIRKYYKPDGR